MAFASTGTGFCPDCGARLTAEPWAVGLCLSCLLELGLTLTPQAPDDVGSDAELPTVSPAAPPLGPGEVLGNRYRIRSLLGSGGMGEVFRAFDLKLRVDVALKAVRPALLADERALTALRHEVRAAREVVSPNVCRVFDLVELDGRELVSMEYVDGVTLGDVLRERSPLALQEAREIASQFLAGLEAIHAAGLVHRDIKPENLMLTRAGRVVVMDFGIARAAAPMRGGTVSGTPVYMAPEHARGDIVDARADVFSAGVVLAEMVAPGGARTHEAREAIWRGLHAEPPDLGNTPWTAVLRKSVSRVREQRYATAAALARALEEVTHRTTGDESQHPYPGLAVFTERDADYFVGRELEIEEMWKKLRRPQLLALIGPSGAGKSSFLRAGLAYTAPPGWSVVFATPSDRPFAALAHALAPELSGDVEAVAKLIDFEQSDVAVDVMNRWRQRHDHALLILDQFEELFTQSPGETQERFAQLLGRLALDADVHVLLSIRDDFLFHCHRFQSLAPVFSELTVIGPPTGAALRRALVQPALKCGYRFDDESVIEEMLAQVAGERGALPLVAFAMARLWDRRDRERGLLTRAAYSEIGGVAGALARHAETTLERIGQERMPIVRELLRNLVTAQGTRAALNRDELLSVFADGAGGHATNATRKRRDQAEDVLDALIAARLLTSYEVPSDERDASGHRRIEIVHESLLTAWPRLVRWQTQDQEGAQLRDQLRQAARLWEDRGKPEDLLWTGTSFREYELWRERYAGTLTTSEEKFTRAMTARTLRRRRQRRLAIAAVIVAAVAVAAAMTTLWRRSEAAREQAVMAAQHAEAQQLFTLGQAELVRDRGAALAYTLASLERNDSPHARRFALRVLWHGPTPFRIAPSETRTAEGLRFSNDNRWLAAFNSTTGATRFWSSDGSPLAPIPASRAPGNFAWGGFTDDGRSFVVTQSDSIRVFALPDVRETNRIAGAFRWGIVRGQSVVTGSFVESGADGRSKRLIRKWSLPQGTPEPAMGVITFPNGAAGNFDVDANGESMFSVHGGQLYEMPLRELGRSDPRLALRSDDPIVAFAFSPDDQRIYTWGESGLGRVWSRRSGTELPGPLLKSPAERTLFSTTTASKWLTASFGSEVAVWNVDGPVGVDPLEVRTGGRILETAVSVDGLSMATSDDQSLKLWRLTAPYPQVLRAPDKNLRDVVIDSAGRWVAALSSKASIWMWSMQPGVALRQPSPDINSQLLKLAVSPNGDRLAAATASGVSLIPLDGGRPEPLAGFTGFVTGVAFDSAGRRLASGGGLGTELVAPGEAVIRIWNVETREVEVLDAGDGQPINGVEFIDDGHLLSTGLAGMRRWDVTARKSELLMEGIARAVPSRDGRYALAIRGAIRPGGSSGVAGIYDLHEKRWSELPSHGTEVTTVAWLAGQVVTGSADGIVRVGDVAGGEPHLLMGHDAAIASIAVAADGHRIVSAADDGTVRVWSVPEGQPFHTLSRSELLDRLRSLTNYRVISDPSSQSGYRVDFEPFAGWNQKLPRW